MLRQEDHKFKATLGSLVGLCLTKAGCYSVVERLPCLPWVLPSPPPNSGRKVEQVEPRAKCASHCRDHP